MTPAAKIEKTALFAAMLASGRYEDKWDIIATIQEMQERVMEDGEDPSEVLHEEGFEPDYVLDLLG